MDFIRTISFSISVCLMVIFSHPLSAQKEFIRKETTYGRAKIYKKDYKILKVRNLILINDSVITYNDGGAVQPSRIRVDDLRYISVRKGNHALAYGLIGSGIGLFSVAITHLKYSGDRSMDDFNWATLYAGMTLGCGVTGAIIGAFDPKWKRLYIKNKESAPTVMILPGFQFKDVFLIGLYITI